MGMAHVDYEDPKTLWRRRADRIGLRACHGKYVTEMDEKEIEAAFVALSREYGISYIWCD